MFDEKENFKNCKFVKIFRKFLLLVWSTILSAKVRLKMQTAARMKRELIQSGFFITTTTQYSV